MPVPKGRRAGNLWYCSGMACADLLPSLPIGSRVLFVRLRSLGDTVLSTPLYSALKRWRPDLRIAVLAETPNDQVLANNPDIEQVLPVSGERDLVRSFASRVHALKGIRKARFDCCINLHGGSTSAWLTLLSGSARRVGLKSFRNGFAYTHILEVPSRKGDGTKWHTVEYQMEWLRRLGLPPGAIPPLRVVPPAQQESSARSRLNKLGITPGARYALIQPASRFFTKEWTPEGFAKVAEFLVQEHDLQVLLSGGPGEEPKLRNIRQRCNEHIHDCSSILLGELLWVLRGARLFVGNDSGPAHLAAAMGVPSVILYGSSDAGVWHPWMAPYQRVQNSFDCNPCPGYRCLVYDEPKCILSITVSQVQLAVNAALRAGAVHAPRSPAEIDKSPAPK
ncbi:MAG: glycosyltransferase family 9 protein [Acidimicrobiia bacterium]|nr:glycosyltransferase family 9 protein [Acidimicrobiia bacterium]